MSLKRTVTVSAVGWIVLISALHAGLNLRTDRRPDPTRKQFRVGFIPVT
jgi:hypothetical protein